MLAGFHPGQRPDCDGRWPSADRVESLFETLGRLLRFGPGPPGRFPGCSRLGRIAGPIPTPDDSVRRLAAFVPSHKGHWPG